MQSRSESMSKHFLSMVLNINKASASLFSQSVREAGDVQLWALDDGLCMGSISLQTHVSAIFEVLYDTHTIFRKTSESVHVIWCDFTSGNQYGMLPHSAVRCGRDSHWRCAVCGDDHKTEAQACSQSSSLPRPCRPFGVSFTATLLYFL